MRNRITYKSHIILIKLIILIILQRLNEPFNQHLVIHEKIRNRLLWTSGLSKLT